MKQNNTKTAKINLPEGYNPDEALKLENQLCFPLYAASRKIVNAYTPFLKPLGITYTQYLVFMVLWEQDDQMVGEIGEKLHLDNGTLTPLLKKMELAGYVSRSRSKEDERTVIVSLTKEGYDMKTKVQAVPLQVGSCVRLEPREAEELYRLLYKIMEV